MNNESSIVPSSFVMLMNMKWQKLWLVQQMFQCHTYAPSPPVTSAKPINTSTLYKLCHKIFWWSQNWNFNWMTPIWKLFKTSENAVEKSWNGHYKMIFSVFFRRISGLHILSQKKVDETSLMCVYRWEGLIWINKKAKLWNIIIPKYFEVIVHKIKQIYSKSRNVY